MNVEILQKLSTEKLKELQAAVEAEIHKRIDFRLMVGRTGTFRSSSDGLTRQITVVDILIKNAVVVETGKSVAPGHRWRVTKSAITMDGVPFEEKKIRKQPTPSTSPSETYGVDTW